LRQCAQRVHAQPQPIHLASPRLSIDLIGFASFSKGGAAMTVKVDSIEPNIFPAVEYLDARDAGRNVEVILEVKIEGQSTPVTINLSYEQADALAVLLEPFRKS
jgi:hypothetical protein